MSKNIKSIPPVSIVIVHRNSSSTILSTLDGIKKQDYPILEIIIVDNHSTDDSLDKIRKFSAQNPSLHIKILAKKLNTGISNSYNIGVVASKSHHVIIMQADGVLPSKKEITTLMKPVIQESNVSAVVSSILMPHYVWNKYSFWQKCMFAPALEKDLKTFSGKFNYINKKLFLQAGGFDEKNFNSEVGGEDVDLTIRMRKVGKVIETNAKVVHLHYLGKDFSLKSWALYKKLLARSFGRIARLYGFNLSFQSKLLILKPSIAIFLLMIFLFPYNLLPIIIFSFAYMNVMYVSKSTRTNPRIILLPFISIGLIYYETFWMIKEFFSPIKKWKGIR